MGLSISQLSIYSSPAWNILRGEDSPKPAEKKVAFLSCGGSPEYGIDPSQDCNTYPPEKILDDLKINYKNGAEELLGERDNIDETLSSIDYRFTEGINRVIVEEREKCVNSKGKVYRGRYISSFSGAKIELCRQIDGKGGAFEDVYTLRWVLHHEVGHHVEYKIGGKTSEFYGLLTPEFYPSEAFAEGFARSILAGPFYRRFKVWKYPDIIEATYNWFKTNIFCDSEYQEIHDPYYQYLMAESYYNSNDYELALTEFENIVENFPDSEYLALAKIGMGKSYAGLGECDKALELLEAAKLEHAEVADLAQYQIAVTYRDCLRDYSSALREYQELIDEFPDSDLVPNALFSIGYIYIRLRDCGSALEAFKKFIDAYPNDSKAARALMEMGLCHVQLNDCVSAIEVFQRLIDEYPDSVYVPDALEMIASCTE